MDSMNGNANVGNSSGVACAVVLVLVCEASLFGSCLWGVVQVHLSSTAAHAGG